VDGLKDVKKLIVFFAIFRKRAKNGLFQNTTVAHWLLQGDG